MTAQGIDLLERLFDLLATIFDRMEIVVKIEDGWRVIVAVRLRRPPVNFKWFVDGKELEVAQIDISPDKKRVFSIQPIDNKGKPAKVDGVPVWDVTPKGGVLLFPSADGLSCELAYESAFDNQVLTVSADADLGPGIRTITGSLDIRTLPREAVGFSITPGAEVDI